MLHRFRLGRFIAEYNTALKNSLTAAGLSESQVEQAVQAAINEQLQYELTAEKEIEYIPRRIPLRM